MSAMPTAAGAERLACGKLREPAAGDVAVVKDGEACAVVLEALAAGGAPDRKDAAGLDVAATAGLVE
jgi:hypothetical protein